MKIETIYLKNFRSVKEAKVYLSEICGLVGENNSGKSSLLRALNCFFNYDKEALFFLSAQHRYSPKSLPVIEMSFVEVPKVQMFQSKLGAKQRLTLRLKPALKTGETAEYYYKKGNKYHRVSSNFIGKLKAYIQFIYIPTLRSHADAVLKNDYTLLKELVRVQIQKQIGKRDHLTPEVKRATTNIKKHVLDKLSRKLEKLYSLNHDLKVDIAYDLDTDYSLLLNKISLQMVESKINFAIEDCGAGIQSMMIIALYRFLASLKHNRYVLGIEEPEINLHPQSQRELIEVLKNESDRGEIQVVFTTHSPVIADQLEHNELILFRKVVDKTRGFRSDLFQIEKTFFEDHKLRSPKYYKFFRYKNSEFFFAKYVIIVESKNDAQVVGQLLSAEGVELDLLAVSIINLEGITSLKYPFYLLRDLKIPHLIVLDKDFFLPYSDNKLEKSRDKNGFPKYGKAYKNDPLIEKLLPNAAERALIAKLLLGNHSKALDKLERHNIICFKYNLETDLAASSVALSKYFSVLKIKNPEKQTTWKVLHDYKDKIKDSEVLLNVIDGLPQQNLPNSYKRIKKHVKQKIKLLHNQSSTPKRVAGQSK